MQRIDEHDFTPTVILLNIMCSMLLSTVCQYCVSTTCYVMCKKFGMCWTSFLFGVRQNYVPHPIRRHSLPDLPTCTKVGRPSSHLAQPESCAANSYTVVLLRCSFECFSHDELPVQTSPLFGTKLSKGRWMCFRFQR